MYSGDMYDDIRKLFSMGLPAKIVAHEIGWSVKYLYEVLQKSRRFTQDALNNFENRRDILFALAEEAQWKKRGSMIRLLAIYLAASERVLLNREYPFGWLPQPKEYHLEKSREIAKRGESALALELLKLDFQVKKKLQAKMNTLIKHGWVKVRVDNETWRGLLPWLDVWRIRLKNSKKGQKFLGNCLKMNALNAEMETIHDERREIFERLTESRGRKKQSVNKPCLTLSLNATSIGRKANEDKLHHRPQDTTGFSGKIDKKNHSKIWEIRGF